MVDLTSYEKRSEGIMKVIEHHYDNRDVDKICDMLAEAVQYLDDEVYEYLIDEYK